MKKTVKSLIIAASVAAIAGIGAVSFAAWSSGNLTQTVNGGGTSHLSTVGFADSTTTTLANKLAPYNQGDEGTNTDTITGADKIYHIALVVAGNDVADYTIKGYYTAEKGGAAYAWQTGSALKYLIDTTGTTAYTEDNADDWTDWTAATGENPTAAALEVGDSFTLAEGTYYVHIILDSSKAADMDVNLAFYFELAE